MEKKSQVSHLSLVSSSLNVCVRAICLVVDDPVTIVVDCVLICTGRTILVLNCNDRCNIMSPNKPSISTPITENTYYSSNISEMSNQASTSTSGIKTKQTISNNQTWPNNSSKANVSSSSKGARNLVSPIIPDIREYLFKLLVIGELGTGKTSFVKRYVHQYFSQHYRATVCNVLHACIE